MKDPKGYKEAMTKKSQTDRVMNGLRQRIINGRKRDDEFTTTHT